VYAAAQIVQCLGTVVAFAQGGLLAYNKVRVESLRVLQGDNNQHELCLILA
jgi:hypothetical protein